MPAQILPLMDDTSAALQMERMSNQVNYHEQQLALRETALQNEQNLAPLRQQIMQSELQRSQQAGQESMQRMVQAKQQAPYDLARTQALTQGAQLENQQKQNDIDVQPLKTQRLQIANAADLHDELMKSETHRLQQSLGQQELDYGPQKHASELASHLSMIASQPQAVREAALEPLKPYISPQSYQEVMDAQTSQKDYEDTIRKYLGDEAGLKFQRLQIDAKAPTSSGDSNNIILGKPTRQAQAEANLVQLFHAATQVRDSRRKNVPIDPPMGDNGMPNVDELQPGVPYNTGQGPHTYDPKTKTWTPWKG